MQIHKKSTHIKNLHVGSFLSLCSTFVLCNVFDWKNLQSEMLYFPITCKFTTKICPFYTSKKFIIIVLGKIPVA